MSTRASLISPATARVQVINLFLLESKQISLFLGTLMSVSSELLLSAAGMCFSGLLRWLLFLLPHAACSQASRAPLVLARDAVDLFPSRLLENVITAIKIYYLIIGAASGPLCPVCFFGLNPLAEFYLTS